MPESPRWDYEVDVLVAGSGNGGMTAGIVAAQAGASTMVIEVGSVTGGSSAWSGGVLTPNFARSHDELVEITHGMFDEAFSTTLMHGWTVYKRWLLDIGAAVWPLEPGGFIPVEGSLAMGTDASRPTQPQTRDFFDSLTELFERAGGILKLKTRALRLLTDSRGEIIGLRARMWTSSPLETDGPLINIAAKKVVLSLGGFMQNKALCARYVAPQADMIAAVGVPYNRGDGMQIGQAVGASLSNSMSHVYGALMSAYPARRWSEDPDLWESLTETQKSRVFDLLYFMPPPGWIGVNLEGERFVDEGDVYYRLAQAVARQTRGMGIMIFDEQMFRAVAELRMSVPGTGASEGEKWEERARLEGDVLIKADSIEALAEKLAQRGPHETYKPNLLATIEECNRAADAGDGNLRIHRSQPVKLEHGPFYAWAFTAGVVYTMGGLAINTKAEVLDSQRAPIRGLYATPPCAGGVFRDYYGGSIASAGIFGYIAGRNAAEAVGCSHIAYPVDVPDTYTRNT